VRYRVKNLFSTYTIVYVYSPTLQSYEPTAKRCALQQSHTRYVRGLTPGRDPKMDTGAGRGRRISRANDRDVVRCMYGTG